MRIRIIRFAFLLLCSTPILISNLFAQNTDDCIVYKKILLYLNKKEAETTILYEGIIDPESGDIGTPVLRDKGLYQNNFYIVDGKSDFGYSGVRSWFSNFMKDSTLLHKNYIYNKDSIINCTFDDGIKYQYRKYGEIIEFTEKEFLHEKIGGTDVYYSPMRITFSKVLYSNENRALVWVKFFAGAGGGGDRNALGFIFNKNNDDWVLSRVENI